jgi:Reverse transcriptase (RNA-dependent DNA polymerase)
MANLSPQRRSNRNPRLFKEAFSEEAVIRELCKARVRLAGKRNDALFFHRISKGAGRSRFFLSTLHPIEEMFPPRRQWHRFRSRDRRIKPSTELNLDALYRAVRSLRASTPEAAWVRKLNEKIAAIRQRVFSAAPFTFSSPKIVPIEKAAKEHFYRPLALLSADDKIIDSLVARYLRKTLDLALRQSCIAFRCRRGKKIPPTIHDALKKLCDVSKRHRRRGCYVAECDIKGFFDCVSHKVALSAFNQLIRDARRKNRRLKVDGRAMEIFSAYLSAYSFPRNVLEDSAKELLAKDPQGEFAWPRRELEKLHKHSNLHGIGVPQGGALSCLIANAVLHAADKSLDSLKRKLGKSFTYLRYCDDMILLAREKKTCTAAFKRYLAVVSNNLLPVHAPKKVRTYSKDFWKGKSNSPYLWARPERNKGIPWIQFVGFQVRYDGLVRVRPKSLKKHIQKLTAAADGMLAKLNPGRREGSIVPPFAIGLRKSNRQIIHRFRQRLISMAVGRARLGRRRSGPLAMCWANGFRGLLGRRIVRSNLKTLDRHRERQIRRIVKRLRLRPEVRNSAREPVKGVHKYYGAPFSYWGQFRVAERRSRKNRLEETARRRGGVPLD